MTDNPAYPVVDLFAGPGGLGEGFASLLNRDQQSYAFRIAVSIEKDEVAHRTLQLRHFFRSFSPGAVPDDYYAYLEGKITCEQLYEHYPEAAARVRQTAWHCELGKEPYDLVQKRIAEAVIGYPQWVLVGGPPCQAYSRVGRSRMKAKANFEEDPRHYLYREYLRILADHKPPMFVMENVKGLLSAKIRDEFVIHDILRDLQSPRKAIYGSDDVTGYTLYSLSQPGVKDPDSDPASFVVKAEDYGIPQARHRIFILGIRNDINIVPSVLTSEKPCTVRQVIGDLPPLRSRISGSSDTAALIRSIGYGCSA